jgi:hypothetical protein
MGQITMDEGAYTRMKKAAEAHRQAVRHGEQEGITHVRHGHVKEGVFAFGGAYAGVFQALLVGAGLYYLVQSKTFSEMEVFKKYWWFRGLLLIAGGILLFRQGYPGWGKAIVATGGAIFVQDHKEHGSKTGETKGFDDETGWYGRWHRWDEPWAERRREDWERRLEGRRARELADDIYERAVVGA